VRVGICQVDGEWPNLALAKLAAHHRAHGDRVEHFMPLADYDRVYASKVFADTPDDLYLPPDTIRGGTGYSLTSVLPYEVEATRPDFSLWPRWDKSMGFTTRGCVRRCPFCVVPRKEGGIRVVAQFGDVWDGRSSEVILLDNNVTAAPLGHFRSVLADAKRNDVTLDFSQGFDARLWTDEHMAAVVECWPFRRRVHFAFDNVRDETAVRRVVSMWKASGLHPDRLVFYVLIGFDSTPEQDMYRVELLRSLGVNPFVMKFKRTDPYQTRFARWVNNKVAFKAMSWPEWCGTFKTTVPS